MTKKDLSTFLRNFSDDSPLNVVPGEIALNSECVGTRLFERPLTGVSSARDPLYESFTKPAIIGENYLPPLQWLSGAQSVISLFNPFTRPVKKSNAGGGKPSSLWLHGRIEGQVYVLAAAKALAEYLRSKGAEAMVPVADQRFKVYRQPKIYSNWSERHAAYLAGMGTFSLNRALITQKGMAGRLCSVITDIKLPPNKRPRAGIYENCSLCGACLKACPVKAINKHGKAHQACDAFLEKTKTEYSPRYGCGKCQCAVPCESAVPGKNPRADYRIIKNNDNGN